MTVQAIAGALGSPAGIWLSIGTCRLAQHVVVANCIFSNQHEQFASAFVLGGSFAPRLRVECNINRVTHLHGNFVAGEIRRTVPCSLARLDLGNDGDLPLRLRLAKNWKCDETLRLWRAASAWPTLLFVSSRASN